MAGLCSQGPLPLLCLFLGPGLGFHLHLHYICQTLIKAPASPVSSPLSSLLPWEKDLGLERALALGARDLSLGPGPDT